MNRPRPVQLSPDDAKALDALIQNGLNPGGLPDRHAERGRKVAQVMGLLDQLPEPRPGDILVHKTLERIARARQQERFTQQIAQLGGGGGSRFRLSELLTAAAVILIGLSIVWPVLENARAGARQFACKQNMAAAGRGFAAYAAENQNLMPAIASRPGSTWWNVGQTAPDGAAQSNSQHLMTLIRAGHATAKDLSCPENVHAILRFNPRSIPQDWPNLQSVSFSYQNQFTPLAQRLDTARRIAILADRNPLIQPGQYRRGLPATATSSNHASLGGQNVLLTTGNVVWMPTPVLDNGDNIWQVRGATTSTGTEVPTDPDDSHLVP